jgi:hypothetical protein
VIVSWFITRALQENSNARAKLRTSLETFIPRIVAGEFGDIVSLWADLTFRCSWVNAMTEDNEVLHWGSPLLAAVIREIMLDPQGCCYIRKLLPSPHLPQYALRIASSCASAILFSS